MASAGWTGMHLSLKQRTPLSPKFTPELRISDAKALHHRKGLVFGDAAAAKSTVDCSLFPPAFGVTPAPLVIMNHTTYAPYESAVSAWTYNSDN